MGNAVTTDGTPQYEYDVFISYSSKDEQWVHGDLLPRLEKAGLGVCIDYRDFRPGRAAVLNMEQAVLASAKTLLVLTPDYFGSGWTKFENLLAQTLDPGTDAERLIPLLKAKCDLPPRIKMLTYVNMADPEDPAISWRQLLTALGAPPTPEPPAVPTYAGWSLVHPYPMPPNFTGRLAERQMLTDWLTADPAHPLLVLRALGGFGKSALCWHWVLHDVSPAAFPRVLWWSFYETQATFDAFTTTALAYLGADPSNLGPRQRAEALVTLLRQPGTLLVLDGFERELRAYSGMAAAYQGDTPGAPIGGRECDCVDPFAEWFLRAVSTLPGLRSKVLLNTRLRPRPVETNGTLLVHCREEELLQMHPADAVAFFLARGIRGTRAEIESACTPYGYHPLSLALLAGLIATDPRQPGDIAAAARPDVSGSLTQRQNHVLQCACDSLSPASRLLLGRIACFLASVPYEALSAIAKAAKGAEDPDLDPALRDLVHRGLLHHDHKTTRYDPHPIVRYHAYVRLTEGDRTTTHTAARNYFAAVPKPEKVRTLDDLLPVVELYHHTVRAGRFDQAFELFCRRIANGAYFKLGAYLLSIELLWTLFPDGKDRPPRLKNERDQAWALNDLAADYAPIGQPRRAVTLRERAKIIAQKKGDKKNIAIALSGLGDVQLRLGSFAEAESNLRRGIVLDRDIPERYAEARGHARLGLVLACRGAAD